MARHADAQHDFIALQPGLIHTAAYLSRLAAPSATAGGGAQGACAEDGMNHLASGAFVVGVLVQFKRGESALANAPLGAEIMPSDVEPTTAAVSRIAHS